MAVPDQMADSSLCQTALYGRGSLDLKAADAKYGASYERWDRMIYVHSYQASPTNLSCLWLGGSDVLGPDPPSQLPMFR
jgi:hypothetical protein